MTLDSSYIDYSDRDAYLSDEGLPSPSEFGTNHDTLDDDKITAGSSLERDSYRCKVNAGTKNPTLQTSDSSDNITLSFNDSKTAPHLHFSLDQKRKPSPNPAEQSPKRLRSNAEETEYAESNVHISQPLSSEQQPVPEWAKDLEPDLVAYFFGSDLW